MRDQYPWLDQPTELFRMLDRYAGNAAALSRATGCPVDRIKRRRRRWERDQLPVLETLQVAMYHTQLMDQVWLQGNAMLTSDWHLPLTDYGVVDLMLGDAVRYDCTQALVVAGDYFHMDALGQHDPKQANAGLERELAEATRTMRRVLDVFDHVYITLGNHDDRLVKTLGHRVAFERCVTLALNLTPAELARITVTGRDYVMVDTPTGPWRVCHTRSYSKQPLVLPGRLADRHRCNIAAGHRHHHAVGFSPSGYRTVEMGGLFDTSRTEYLDRYTTDYPLWKNGYTMLLDGEPFAPLLHATPPPSGGCTCT